MVQAVGLRCKSAWEMSRERRLQWDGYIVLDEKLVRLSGKQQWFYVAIDRTGDVVHVCAVQELMTTEAIRFLEELQELGYPCRGVVTDLDPVLTKAVAAVYGGKPHQYCLKHALANVERVLGYTPIVARHKRLQARVRLRLRRLPDRRGIWREKAQKEFVSRWETLRAHSKRYQAITVLRESARRVLFARNENEAREHLQELRRSHTRLPARKWKVVRFLERNWDYLMVYHRVRGLPRTSNLAEGFNKQLERRLKTIEAFQHPETAIVYINLLVAYLRQKPYTDCRGYRKGLNGKTRLQAAGAKRAPNDWLASSLKRADFGNR